jgi:CheY-like chemotaxis protein
MRSTSRRDAIPARASSLAMRCGPLSRAGGVPRRFRGTVWRFVRSGGKAVVPVGGEMLFGKRNRIVKRILIVEDEPLTAFDNEVMLADLGYDVVATLDSFGQAIALLDREDVDLVLTDVRLTGKRSGLDLARASKERGIPVLFSTGHRIPEESKALAIGCLTKPYTERQLKNALEAIDRLLAGEKVEAPKGLDLYPAEEG